jgi:transposase InsO family protein
LAQYLWRHFGAWLEYNWDPKARLLAEVLALKAELARLREEVALKDARMACLPPKRRPHYSPEARLRILALKASQSWSLAATARRFQVSRTTIASWVSASAEAESSLLKQRRAVNSLPDFVASVVQQLKVTVPMLGRRKIAQYLARAGLALSASTVARRLKQPPVVPPPRTAESKGAVAQKPVTASRVVSRYPSRYPGHVWGMDITLVPTLGFSVPWWPRALPPVWPICWHVLLVLDHFSRAVVHTAVFLKNPTESQVTRALGLAAWLTGTPRHLITDRGSQFGAGLLAWCDDNDIEHRYGALGRHGSIAVVERVFRTMKYEFLRRKLLPARWRRMSELIRAWQHHYNRFRPHAHLRGATPAEIRDGAPHETAQQIRNAPPNAVRNAHPSPKGPAPGACRQQPQRSLRAAYRVAPPRGLATP